MRRALLILFIILLAVRAWVWFSENETPGAETGSSPPAAAEEVEIAIGADGVRPRVAAVGAGAEVEWINEDSQARTLQTAASGLEDAVLPPGEAVEWEATESGVIHYTLDAEGQEGHVVVLGQDEQLFAGRTAAEEFQDSCSGCHGPDRRGAIGPALLPERLTESDHFYFETIKDGRPGTVMPAWGEQGLTEKEIWMLVGYIRSQPDAAAMKWEMADVAESRQVMVSPEELAATPVHEGNLDNLMLVTEREARSIAVFDGDRHELLGHIPASYRAHGYVFHPSEERWVYNVGRDGWLFKIDLYTLQPVSKVRVGLDSRGLAISDDGRYLIAGNFMPRTAVILDAETLEPLKVIEARGENLEGEEVDARICITSDVSPQKVGPYFIIALKEAGQVWRIDYSQPDFPIEKVKNVGRVLHDGFLSPDNRFFYLASQDDNLMAVIDVEAWEVVDRIETGDTPHPGSGATWEADGRQYGATVHAGEGLITVWDLADNEIVARVETSGPGLFIRSHEESPYVWADTMFAEEPNKIYAIDKETFEVVKVIDEGSQTLHPEFTKDGSVVYVSDWMENVVRVYDAESFEKIAEIGGVETPTGVFNTHRRAETLGH